MEGVAQHWENTPGDTLVRLSALVDAVNAHTFDAQHVVKYLATIGDVQIDLCDIVALHWEREQIQREQIKTLIATALSHNVITQDSAKLILPPDLIEHLGIVSNAAALKKAEIRYKTNQIYTQKKFNLFREESEGYAKLITEIWTEKKDLLVNRLRSLVGVFHLDPNRVLDVLLEQMAAKPKRQDLLQCLELFEPRSIADVLGFKIKNESDVDRKKRLIYICAVLIRDNSISLKRVYAHLGPSDEEMLELREKYISEILSRVHSMKVVNFNEEGKKAETSKIDLNWCPNNDKFLLISALLKLEDWERAEYLLSHLKNVQPASHPEISSTLCNRAHKILDALNVEDSIHKIFTSSEQMSLDDGIDDGNLENLFKMISYISIYLSRNPTLFSRICRALKSLCSEEKYKPIITNAIKTHLFPSFCLFPANRGLSNEFWMLLKEFPYEQRFSLYGFWRAKVYNMHVELIFTRTYVEKCAKDFVKRLVGDRVREIGRQLIKVTHSNPVLLIDLFLYQVKKFDNLSELVVDSFKYLSNLSLDVVNFLLLYHLSDLIKSKLKPDGVNFSLWFNSLSTFSGLFFKKYPDVMLSNPSVLQYVVNQLKFESSVDVFVIQQLLENMVGIKPKENMTYSQILGQSGDKLLRHQLFDQVKSFKNKTKRQGSALKAALIQKDLLQALLVLMFQQKHHVVFKQTDLKGSKVIGALYDRVQDSIVQLIDFIDTYFTDDEYASCLPSFHELCEECHLDVGDAFTICRTVLHMPQIVACDPIDESKVEEGEVLPDPLEMVVSNLLPNTTWNAISPKLYCAFWKHSLYDLFVPRKQYQEAVKGLKSLDAPDRKKKDRAKITQRIDDFRKEQERQTENNERVIRQFRGVKDLWLKGCDDREKTPTVFIQHCLFPRAIATDADAVYCAKFVILMHSLDTPWFSTIGFFLQVTDIGSMIAICTQKEATRFALFLKEILTRFHKWRDNENTYEKEFKSVRGSSIYFDMRKMDERMSYSDFKMFVSKCHQQLKTSFLECLKSKNDLNQRNALLILDKVRSQFPRVKEHCSELHKQINSVISTSIKGSDIHTLAPLVHSTLQSLEQNLIEEALFSGQSPQKHAKGRTTKGTDTVRERGERSRHDTNLRSSAAEFAPKREESKSRIVRTGKNMNVKVEKLRSTNDKPIDLSKSPKTPNLRKTELSKPSEDAKNPAQTTAPRRRQRSSEKSNGQSETDNDEKRLPPPRDETSKKEEKELLTERSKTVVRDNSKNSESSRVAQQKDEKHRAKEEQSTLQSNREKVESGAIEKRREMTTDQEINRRASTEIRLDRRERKRSGDHFDRSTDRFDDGRYTGRHSDDAKRRRIDRRHVRTKPHDEPRKLYSSKYPESTDNNRGKPDMNRRRHTHRKR